MITFPTTVDAFIADQEKRAGRKFDDFQRELLGGYAELFNLEFDVGMKGEEPINVLKDTRRVLRPKRQAGRVGEACT